MDQEFGYVPRTVEQIHFLTMNIQQYREFINSELDKAEREHGNIPVVSWYHNKMLSEHVPTLISVRSDLYTGIKDRTWNEREGVVLILGE